MACVGDSLKKKVRPPKKGLNGFHPETRREHGGASSPAPFLGHAVRTAKEEPSALPLLPRKSDLVCSGFHQRPEMGGGAQWEGLSPGERQPPALCIA